MSSRMWMILWFTLFAGQWGILYHQQRIGLDNDKSRESAGTGIRQLIQNAEIAWREFLPDSGSPGERFTPSSSLLRREQARLHLGELEDRLRAEGASVSLAADLEGWLDAASGRLVKAPDAAYIDGLMDWYVMALESGKESAMEQSRLDPETRSPWPSIAFDIEGLPSELGQRIGQFLKGNPRWSLGELELVSMSEKGRWWIRGSWVFERDTR